MKIGFWESKVVMMVMTMCDGDTASHSIVTGVDMGRKDSYIIIIMIMVTIIGWEYASTFWNFPFDKNLFLTDFLQPQKKKQCEVVQIKMCSVCNPSRVDWGVLSAHFKWLITMCFFYKKWRNEKAASHILNDLICDRIKISSFSLSQVSMPSYYWGSERTNLFSQLAWNNSQLRQRRWIPNCTAWE